MRHDFLFEALNGPRRPLMSARRLGEDIARDLRHAIRLLFKHRHVNAFIIVILALGIAVNTTVFSFLQAAVLRPFPYDDPDQIVELFWGERARFSGTFNNEALRTLRRSNNVFDAVEGYLQRPMTITTPVGTERAPVTEVTAGIFQFLGIQPTLGRAFSLEEQRQGLHRALIGHHLWITRYTSDPEILGKTIRVEGQPHTIVGVMPRGFSFYQGASVWVPLPANDPRSPGARAHRFTVIARIKDDTTPTQARATLPQLAHVLRSSVGEPEAEEQTLRLITLSEGWLTYGLGLMAGLLQAVAGLFLLIVFANVASLLLSQGIARNQEVATRRALGAPRRRLIRQLLTENLLLVLAAATLGTLAAVWGRDLLTAMFPPSPLIDTIELPLDLGVLSFVLALAALAVFAVGTTPALELSRLKPGRLLKEWGPDVTIPIHARRWQSSLAVVQIALSVILLVGAMLTIRASNAMQQVEPGFEADRVLRVRLDFYYGHEGDRDALIHRALERVSAVSGVESVAWTGSAPREVIGYYRQGPIATDTGTSRFRAWRSARVVSPSYFDTLGLPISRGRVFSEYDDANVPYVAVLSDQAAHRLWPNQDPIGKRLRYPGARSWITVIGVVGDVVRVGDFHPGTGARGPVALATPDIYLSAKQALRATSNLLLVRSAVEPTSIENRVRKAVADVAPNVPVGEVRTVKEAQYEAPLFLYRLIGTALGGLAALSVMLAALGTFSVVWYSWMQRSREIAIRVALGATPRDVLRLVSTHSVKLASLGVLVGTAAAVLIYRPAAGLLYGIRSYDAVTYSVIALFVLAVGWAAGLVPARRAKDADPAELLRQRE